MSGTESRQEIADERQPLAPGTRIGNAYLVLKTTTTGTMAFGYEALRLADQANVSLFECCPRGLAIRGPDGRVAPIRGWEEELAAAITRFEVRLAALKSLAAPGSPAVAGLALPAGRVEDGGTLYAVAPGLSAPSLSVWSGDLMRRPGDADLARLSLRLGKGLQALHHAGIGHGAIGEHQIHLDEPGNAVLAGLMLEDMDPARSAATDIRALAAALYSVITGRMPPPEARDRSLDTRFSARHIAAGDYADSLLDAVDAALGLGEGAEPVDPSAWLSRLLDVSAGILGEDQPEKGAGIPPRKPAKPVPGQPVPAGPGSAEAKPSGQAAPPKVEAAAKAESTRPEKPTPAPRSGAARDAEVKPAGSRSGSMRYAALAGLVLAGLAGWLGFMLLSGTSDSPRAPQIARTAPAPEPAPAPAPAPTPPAVVAAPPATPPRVEAAKPEPAIPEPAKPEPERPEPPPAAAPVPPPRVDLALPTPPPIPAPPAPPAVAPPAVSAADLAGATTREAVLALLARGAPREAVANRLAVLGYVAVTAAGETIFRKPGEGEVFRDCTICPELMLVPPGRTEMQVTIADATRRLSFAFEKPLAVARFEVTRGQYAAFMRETGRTAPGGCHARRPQWGVNPALSWEKPGFAQGDDHPVTCVSFQDANAYAEWLSARTGARYRLPSDAEWHYFASAEGWRTGEADELCRIGNGADLSAREANPDWQAITCRDGFAETAPVGRYAAGPWGLHDLNGNVWEWVGTCAPDPTPDAEFPPRTCGPGAPRLLRGGSWADAPSLRQLDSRIISAPVVRDQVAGFRLVREP